jgi:hypothetical protein
LETNLGYSLRERGTDCEIVLYGDSTALTALDPAVVKAQTGMTACNISELGSVHQVVTSYFPLDEYLAHNARPKVIYTQWSAFAFHPHTIPMAEYQEEGIEYAMLYDRTPAMWKGLLYHPLWMVKFAIWVEDSLVSDIALRAEGKHAAKVEAMGPIRDLQGGIWRFPLPPETHCGVVFPVDGMSHESAADEIEAFKQRYSTGGTEVIVDVSPVAECVRNRESLLRATSGLGDNQLTFLPVGLFNENDYHFTKTGSDMVSKMASRQILERLRNQTAVTSRDRSGFSPGVTGQ